MSDVGVSGGGELAGAVRGGQWPRAFALAEGALARGQRSALAFKVRAIKLEQQGRFEEAAADLWEALQIAPNDPAALNALGLCLGRAGRTSEALDALQAAVTLAPNMAAAHFNLGWLLETTGNLGGARREYETAIELQPEYPEALASLSAVAGGMREPETARDLAQRALRLNPAEPTAVISLARLDLQEGRAGAAEARLRELLARGQASAHARGVATGLLGDALDRLGRFREAFAAYRDAAAQHRNTYAARFEAPGAVGALDATYRLIREFEAQSAERWRTPPAAEPSPARGHAFLVGFPRSGGGRLAQALAAHPDVEVVEDKSTLPDPLEVMSRLPDMDALRMVFRRGRYWDYVRQLGVEPAGKAVVDKDLMNALRLPLVSRAFPDAGVLFMRRDPRDVVLNCFRSQFVPGPVAWEFLDLERTARLYDAVMRLASLYRDKLGQVWRVQRYEDLVSDVEGQGRQICAFLGVEWSGSVAHPAADADARAAAKSSEPHQSGGAAGGEVGAWRRYESELAPVLPILQPWVDAFGYSG